jgi:hypothetical protein
MQRGVVGCDVADDLPRIYLPGVFTGRLTPFAEVNLIQYLFQFSITSFFKKKKGNYNLSSDHIDGLFELCTL